MARAEMSPVFHASHLACPQKAQVDREVDQLLKRDFAAATGDQRAHQLQLLSPAPGMGIAFRELRKEAITRARPLGRCGSFSGDHGRGKGRRFGDWKSTR